MCICSALLGVQLLKMMLSALLHREGGFGLMFDGHAVMLGWCKYKNQQGHEHRSSSEFIEALTVHAITG